MSETVEEIKKYIKEVTPLDFRDGFVACGQVRASAWRYSKVPDSTPNVEPGFDYNLSTFAYSLLDLGLRLRELDSDADEALDAFKVAASAMEAANSGEPNYEDRREFDLVMTALCYHLAQYPARAFYLMSSLDNSSNLTSIERVLVKLMTRDISDLRSIVLKYKSSDMGTDKAIIDSIKAKLLNEEEEGSRGIREDLIAECIDTSLTDTYHSSMSMFLLGLERGDGSIIEEAKVILASGLEFCENLNMVRPWWLYRVSIHLMEGLWSTSYHEVLPSSHSTITSDEWERIRELFISVLYRNGRAEIDLWKSQVSAAKRSVDQSDNLIVSLPTSAGKTRIAELCILSCLASGKRAIYVAPWRSLAAQIETSISNKFSPLGKNISGNYNGRWFNSNDRISIRRSDVMVMTPEKLDIAVRHDQNFLEDVGLLVFDEGHMINLDERGVRYETQIQRLLHRLKDKVPRIVCLSAVFPTGDGIGDFVGWLRQDKLGDPVQVNWKPTRVRLGEVIWKGSHASLQIRADEKESIVEKYISGKSPTKGRRKKLYPMDQRELCIATAWELASKGHSALIFCPLKTSVNGFASCIFDLFNRDFLDSLLDTDISNLSNAITICNEWFGHDSDVVECLKLGVGIHHASLPKSYQREVERLLQDKVLKVVISSPTLTQGVNFPVTAVVIHSLHRSGNIIRSSDFWNIAGRAGRAYFDIEGIVLYPMHDRHESRMDDWNSFVHSKPPVTLSSCIAALVMYLLVLMERLSGKRIDQVAEYIINNISGWDQISDVSMKERNKRYTKEWKDHVSMLDLAILGLVGDEDIHVDEVISALDEALKLSLWSRSVESYHDSVKETLKNVMMSRCQYIWKNSTKEQRKVSFLAGVDIRTGVDLDNISSVAIGYLIAFYDSISDSDNIMEEKAVESIIGIASLMFNLTTFRPKKLPDNWVDILREWLLGRPLSEIESDNRFLIVDFIEDGVISNLSWAVDIIEDQMFRGLKGIFDDGLSDEVERPRRACQAIETGTLNISASVLISAGLHIRSAAISAVTKSGADFEDESGLRDWLESEYIKEVTHDSTWPTSDTHEVWTAFINDIRAKRRSVWKKTEYIEEVDWNIDDPYRVIPLQLYDCDGVTLVLSSVGEVVGRLRRKINSRRYGRTVVDGCSNDNRLIVFYFGPNDFDNES